MAEPMGRPSPVAHTHLLVSWKPSWDRTTRDTRTQIVVSKIFGFLTSVGHLKVQQVLEEHTGANSGSMEAESNNNSEAP